ncbi:hypothetical protein VS_II0655 [Vibrio atlanticus]|uniref:Uncharacterized protein n=1 Tax=Vibrio atlanticus (strain LGP32) TaxID=575788 RepID=B7VRQ7_VIBA3|nr:hypothetical protein VS_II0655 [Vibrio atlanticus]
MWQLEHDIESSPDKRVSKNSRLPSSAFAVFILIGGRAAYRVAEKRAHTPTKLFSAMLIDIPSGLLSSTSIINT